MAGCNPYNLRHDMLDELRLLTNFGLDSARRLCLLLVGQSELRRRMARAHHEAFAQRVVVRYHLSGLQREELEPYLAHALGRAGCELPLFEPPACQALFQASHGLPRMVSSLAHYSLAAAAAPRLPAFQQFAPEDGGHLTYPPHLGRPSPMNSR